jgi:hypothetical protein
MAKEGATAQMIHPGSTLSQAYVNDEDLPKKEGTNIDECLLQIASWAVYITFPFPGRERDKFIE